MMSIKNKSTMQVLDEPRLAELLTPVLLRRYRDDAPYGHLEAKPGQAWLRWGSAWNPHGPLAVD
ncbi:MAG: hypothetical protein AAF658_05750 [Myxococcota bacterium]